MAQVDSAMAVAADNPAKRVKLTGRAFYESIGSPRMIVAPMVDRSEFAWRLLTRSYLDDDSKKQLLAYSPMFHARLFADQVKYRDAHFQPARASLVSKDKSEATPFLDGRSDIDRPLFVQFCANKPDEFLEAAKYAAPYCDAVDLNLGCPQGIAKSGHYGAFLQEDWDTIHNLIRRLRDELEVPVTAKFRIQETKEKTLEYAKMILNAGASIITIHGRQRHQKGHNTGLADWDVIRYVRDNLPPDTVLFANGNILNHNDIRPCLEATKADGVMSAEANLSDPTVFAAPPQDAESREYWRDASNPAIGGYRIDGVFRRYLDIIYRYVLEQEPPVRLPLYIPGDATKSTSNKMSENSMQSATSSVPSLGTKRGNDGPSIEDTQDENPQPFKKQKKKHEKKKDPAAVHNPNLKSMQGHLFQLLRPMISSHTDIRDALARSRAGDIASFEHVLSMVEDATRRGLDEAAAQSTNGEADGLQTQQNVDDTQAEAESSGKSSQAARDRCRRPFWVCQPHIRPLPEEAMKIGAMQLSKKDKKALASQEKQTVESETGEDCHDSLAQAAVTKEVLSSNGVAVSEHEAGTIDTELPREEGLACG